MKLAIVYARYSSNSQTEQSIEGQLDVCQKYAEENDLQIVNAYIDRAMTGTNDNRAAFQQMLTDSEKANWEIVLVYALNRFGRNAVEVAINKQRLKKNGKTLISATQKTSDNLDGSKNLDGILLENFYIGIDEYYSAELAQKVRRGLNENRKKGLFCGGHIPYGYKTVEKRIYIDEEKAKIVRSIFSRYAAGDKVAQICRDLNNQGLLHNGKPFDKNNLYPMLRNKKYFGIYIHEGVTYENMYPKIISAEIYEKVQKILDSNKYGKKPVIENYLLRNKMVCGYCGSPISAECGTSHNGEKKRYYTCHGRKKLRNGCEKTMVQKAFLEDIVLKVLQRELNKPSTLEKIVKIVLEKQERRMGLNPTLSLMIKEKKQIETALNNIMKAIEQGITSSTTNKRLHELEDRQTELEQSIAIENGKKTLCLTEKEIRDYYNDTISVEPQMLINTVVKRIVLYNDRMKIELNSPLRTGPDESQDSFIYNEKTKMPRKLQNSNRLIYTDFEAAICL